VEKVVEKAATLIEALPYIQEFKNKIVVVKLGGSVMDNKSYVKSILRDVVFMHTVGMKPVIVHGGGGIISRMMKERGLQPRFVQGLRVTDKETISVVEEALVGIINKELVEIIHEFNGSAEGHSGKDFGIVSVKKSEPVMQQDAKGVIEAVDLGYVGEIDRINTKPIHDMLQRGNIPVIASLGIGPDNMAYNVNADIVAGEMAIALKAEKLVFLTDVHGVMKNPEDKDSLISTLQLEMVERLMQDGIIAGGMIPKLTACVSAVKSLVKKTHIVDGRMQHSLLLEIFTDEGVGTQIVP
jgi:acetylglutamate kinase